jgi:hypothetical protein
MLLMFRPPWERFANLRTCIQPQEDNRVLDIVPNSENCEGEEIRSESTSGVEEDLADVDANPRDLIVAKSSESYPPSFDFGESKVTGNLIREYEAVGFFPAGDGCAPLDEQTPTPEANEVVVFRDLFTCRLRFPCDPILPATLDKFSRKFINYHRTHFWSCPNSFGS